MKSEPNLQIKIAQGLPAFPTTVDLNAPNTIDRPGISLFDFVALTFAAGMHASPCSFVDGIEKTAFAGAERFIIEMNLRKSLHASASNPQHE